MSVRDKVLDVISDQLGVDKSHIALGSRFVEDLGADSLDVIELVMSAEEKFGIEIPDDEAERLFTVGDAIQYLASRTGQPVSPPLPQTPPPTPPLAAPRTVVPTPAPSPQRTMSVPTVRVPKTVAASSGDLGTAARFLRQSFWRVLLLVIGTVLLSGFAIADSCVPLWPAHRAALHQLAEGLFGVTLVVLVIGVLGVGLQIFQMRPAITAKIQRHWSKRVQAVGWSAGLSALCLIVFFYSTTLTGPLAVAGCLTLPVALFVWQLCLSQLCGVAADACNSPPLKKRAKHAVRNWWIVLSEVVGLVVIGVILGHQSNDTTFIDLLVLIFLPLLLYASIHLMVVLRLTATALVAPGNRGASS